MIYICTALYCEAQPFIEHMNLKKDLESNEFQIFKNQEAVLIITGIGKVKTAVAVTYLLSKYQASSQDLFMNIGVCGAQDHDILMGTAFLCNKIIDRDTKKHYFPEMLLKHPFEESSIETCSFAVGEGEFSLEGQLVDMEASGIYQAANVFLQTHQLFFLKIVSDHLSIKALTAEKIAKLIGDKVETILNWANEMSPAFMYDKNVLSEEEEKILKKISETIKLTVTMEVQLKQLLKYYKLQYGDFTDVVSQYIGIECKSKNEGKKYFEELRKKLI